MAGFLRRTAPTPVTRAALAAALDDAALAERIVVRLSRRARRLSLRIDVGAGHAVLVQPPRMAAAAVLAFAAARREWIADRLGELPCRIAFDEGAVIPLRGETHVLRFAPDARGGVWRDDGAIVVTGRAEHAPRRLIDWLKSEARAAIAPLARELAAALDRRVAAITVRDTTSRWGSCSRNGRLSFSWRLVLAPMPVLRYVVAHEVAHLRHMNHGPAFWRTVDGLLGDADGGRSARQWLRDHGAVLHRYG
jgi:predicted metal-dependent hydrolase